MHTKETLFFEGDLYQYQSFKLCVVYGYSHTILQVLNNIIHIWLSTFAGTTQVLPTTLLGAHLLNYSEANYARSNRPAMVGLHILFMDVHPRNLPQLLYA